jgi:hypothetical protein
VKTLVCGRFEDPSTTAPEGRKRLGRSF